MEDVKSAAHAMNVRSGRLAMQQVSVATEEDLQDGLMSPKPRDGLMGGKNAQSSDGSVRPGGLCSCLTLAYYKPYFDVDTEDVQQRIVRALLPFKKEPTFSELVIAAPDAYGPFWLSSTLVFCLASCSNAASYLDFVGDSNEWKYDFSRLASAYTLVLAFLLGLPLVLWVGGKYVGIPMTLTYLVCLYGYSMTVFIPASFICMIPADALDWVVLLFAMAWSLYFLVSNMWATIAGQVSNEKMFPVLAFVGATQLVWAILMKLCFY
ncbi:TPA: hypothetical protein N0F65_005986 [Lagenidium giganteum]|uniref:Protein YIPF n=1 Tax=Lagenidium giganteum TaxID=4803 RepID=A0AAV2ZBV6_9STRA|nr:TPA: hypothetical protein N0F65_005986 [Lagenidium giganteum]